MHQSLKIVRGLPAINAVSAEKISSLSLMDANGLALDPARPWSPRLPSLKNGGTWDDGGTDGRQLAIANLTNVVETINLKLTASTYALAYQRLASLNRFVGTSRRYSASTYEWQPVYLEWHAQDAPGPQFAMIYNIDVDVEWLDTSAATCGNVSADVILVVEREPTWSSIPPGGNLLYPNTSEVNLTGTINNVVEWTNGYDTEAFTKNYVTIDNIPGDAPAKIRLELDSQNMKRVYLWRSTKPLDTVQFGFNFSSNLASGGYPRLSFLAPDGEPSNSTFTTDTTYGVFGRNSAAVPRVVQFDNTQDSIDWPYPPTTRTDDNLLDLNATRGKFNVYARGYYAGTPDSIQLETTFSQNNVGTRVLEATTISQNQVAGYPELTFLGVLELPFKTDIYQRDNGTGYSSFAREQNPTGNADGQFRINMTATGITASNTYSLIDLILVPYDEPLAIIDIDSSDPSQHRKIVYDTSRYDTRGKPGAYASLQSFSGYAVPDDFVIEVRGQDIELIPGIPNRLQFLIDQADETGSDQSRETMDYDLTIYPRWYGARDE